MIAAILLAALSITRTEIDEAIRLDQEWRSSQATASAEWIHRAARLPWPLPPPDIEAEVALRLDELDPTTRRQWAGDHALVLLSGEMAAPAELVEAVLRDSMDRAPGAPAMKTLTEARRRYAAGDDTSAALRYDDIRQTSSLWTDAIRERAWTSVRLGDRARALGATVSLAAPYFPNEDQVEARLIAAHVLISSCRWREARNLVEGLTDFTETIPDESRVDALLDQPHRPTGLEGRAWDAPLVRRSRGALEALASSVDTRSPLRTRVRATAERLLLESWTEEWRRRRTVAARAVAVLHDAARAERLTLEAGYRASTAIPVDRPPLEDDDVAWPFEGTFWRDELGAYRWLAADHCPREASP